MRRGIRLALDLGSVRIGVARCDIDGILAVPVTTVTRGDGDLAAIHDLARQWEPLEILIGLPVTLSGDEGPAAESVREWARQFHDAYPEHVIRLVDERLTTAAATRGLQAAGRSARTSRDVIDQAAAVLLLEDALEFERRTGQPSGEAL